MAHSLLSDAPTYFVSQIESPTLSQTGVVVHGERYKLALFLQGEGFTSSKQVSMKLTQRHQAFEFTFVGYCALLMTCHRICNVLPSSSQRAFLFVTSCRRRHHHLHHHPAFLIMN
jgi:hypothetical protein